MALPRAEVEDEGHTVAVEDDPSCSLEGQSNKVNFEYVTKIIIAGGYLLGLTVNLLMCHRRCAQYTFLYRIRHIFFIWSLHFKSTVY